MLAIGNPFGFGNTVTMGIVSALGRNHLGINRFEDFIQTDAAINPGNSGGALVDTAGNLIGINSTIFSQSGGSLGIGFAIPVSHRAQRAGADHPRRRGDARLARHRAAGPHARARAGARARERRRRADPRHRAQRPGRPRRHPARATSCWRSTASRRATRRRCSRASPSLPPGAPAKVKVWRDAQGRRRRRDRRQAAAPQVAAADARRLRMRRTAGSARRALAFGARLRPAPAARRSARAGCRARRAATAGSRAAAARSRPAA